jgi:hypothetical protein
VVAEQPEQIRRRLAEVFGDVLPAVTRDELEPREEHRPADSSDEELLANRPPHHTRDR